MSESRTVGLSIGSHESRPSIEISGIPRMGMNVLAYFSYPSGLQESASRYVGSLNVVGVPTSCRDVPVAQDRTRSDPGCVSRPGALRHDASAHTTGPFFSRLSACPPGTKAWRLSYSHMALGDGSGPGELAGDFQIYRRSLGSITVCRG